MTALVFSAPKQQHDMLFANVRLVLKASTATPQPQSIDHC